MLKILALALAVVPFGSLANPVFAGHRGGGCGGCGGATACTTAAVPASAAPVTAQTPGATRRAYSYAPESTMMRAPVYRSYRSSGSNFGDAGAKMRGDFGR